MGKLFRRGLLLLGVVLLLLLTGNTLLGWIGLFRPTPYNGPVWVAKMEKLRLTIVERGTLEAAENHDILCRVKSKSKGGTAATTIKWVIDDGTQVKEGDKLVEFDDSALQDEKKNQLVLLAQAEASLIEAKQNLLIQASQNETDIETAKVNIELVDLDLKKYLQGEYEQLRKDIKGRLKVAQSDQEMWLDRVAWSKRMVKMGYVSRSQAEAEEARLESADISLQKIEEELRVLEQFSFARNKKDLESKLAEARRTLERVTKQAKFKLDLLEAQLRSKDLVCKLEQNRLKEIEEQIELCTVRAPHAGMVVYYMPESSRFSSSSSQGLVEVGAPVKEGQKIMRIPDLSRMVVNTRVHEAMVTYLRNADPDYPEKNQYAQIRVDAHSGRLLRGHVRSVATVPSQSDFFSSDVKVYVTMVEIDETVEKLKPGMSAEVTIHADESSKPVLVIPVQAVVGNITMGEQRKCFVLDENNVPHPRDIVIGMSNENLVEVKSGLQAGEKVVLNTKAVLPPDSNLKPAKSRGGAADLEDEPKGGKGGKGAKGNKGGKGPPMPSGFKSGNKGPEAEAPPKTNSPKASALLLKSQESGVGRRKSQDVDPEACGTRLWG